MSNIAMLEKPKSNLADIKRRLDSKIFILFILIK